MRVCRGLSRLSLLATVALATVVSGNEKNEVRQSSIGTGDAPGWHQYVRAPSTKSMRPRRVLAQYTTGNVSNPEGLITGSAATVLSRLAPGNLRPSIVVDFGQNLVGTLSVRFTGASTGNKTTELPGLPGIRLAFSETLKFLSNRSDFSRSDHASGAAKLTPGTDQIAVRTDPYEWTDQSGCEYGNQVCADGLHGFRYVRISLEALDADAPYTSSYGTVQISSMSLEISAFLGTPDTFAGHFECSDGDLTQWWYDAVYTNDLCIDVFRLNDTEPRGAGSPTLVGKLVLHDGPKRDRDPYVGDLAVSALTSYLSHDASEAARNVLEDLALHQRDDGWIPPASINDYTLPLFDYPLWWVVCSCDYVLYTGNVSFLQAFWPVLVKILDNFYPGFINDATGLLERTQPYGDYAFLPRNGPVTYYNALYVRALNYAADLATAVGRGGGVEARWRSRAQAIGSALLKRNWDASVGAFFDGSECGSHQLCPTHAQDGNSLAILSGIANATTSALNGRDSIAESILAYLGSALRRPYGNAFYDNDQAGGGFSQRVYAFISYFEISARLRIPSAVESGFDELRRLYGWMASQDPGVTFWEGIGPDGSPYEGGFTSMAHGWSTGIVPLMANRVLGIVPTKPGFRGWEIAPVIGGGLTWAKGTVPTPFGEISASWAADDGSTRVGGDFRLEVNSPSGTTGVAGILVSSPDTSVLMSVALDGNVVFNGTKGISADGATYNNAGRVTLQIGSGKHEIWVTSSP